MDKKDVFKLDLYSILGVNEQATEKEIVKGYRKRALKCHPDKNPDNPKAGEEFHQLSIALEILTDIAARAAYDQSRKAKKAAQERTKALDSKRKKFKEDLEARERAFFEQNEKAKEVQAEKKLQAEIERLRKEGSRLLEQEQERLKAELRKSAQEITRDCEDRVDQPQGDTPRIKLKWKAQKTDPSNGGYSATTLTNILSCYGSINTLLVSSKRNGSAIVEFEKHGVSSDILDEKGLTENPFTITWLSGEPSASVVSGSNAGVPDGCFQSAGTASGVAFEAEGSSSPSVGLFPSAGNGGVHGLSVVDSSGRDFESIVLRNMRLAEERKKLIQQMMKEDGE